MDRREKGRLFAISQLMGSLSNEDSDRKGSEKVIYIVLSSKFTAAIWTGQLGPDERELWSSGVDVLRSAPGSFKRGRKFVVECLRPL